MKTSTFLICLVLMLVGCASRDTNVPNYFLFNSDTTSNSWRTRFVEFDEIAREYVQANELDFEFAENQETALFIFFEKGNLTAHYLIGGDFGSPRLDLYLDTSGRVLRHRLGTVTH